MFKIYIITGLLSNSLGFQLKNTFYINKPLITRSKISMDMLYTPTETIKSISKNGLGMEWTYNDVITNLNNRNIEAATITDNNNMVIIDKNYNHVRRKRVSYVMI